MHSDWSGLVSGRVWSLEDAKILWRPPQHNNRCCVPGIVETGTEAELAAQLKAETPEETAARLAREAAAAKDSVRCGLATMV